MAKFFTDLLADKWLFTAAVSQLLLVLWGAIVSLQDSWAKKQRALVLTMFALTGCIGLIATAKQGGESAVANQHLSDSLTNLRTSTQEISRMTSLNTELQKSLVSQGQILSDLAHQNIASVTGGTSFCYIGFDGISETGAGLVVVSEGKYPLYDVDIRVTDAKILATSKDFALSNLMTQRVGNLGQHVASPLGSIPFKASGGSQELNIFFHGRNGFWQQLLRLRKVDNQWRMASIVSGSIDPKRFPKEAILMMKVDKQFPREDIDQDKDWENVSKLPRAFLTKH